MSSFSKNVPVTFVEKPQFKKFRFQNYKHWNIIYTKLLRVQLRIGHCHLFMEATWNYSTVPLKSAQSSLVIDSYLEKIRWATSICNSSLEGEGRSINLRFISILASVSQGHLNQTIFIQTVQGRVYFKAKLYPIWYPINFIRNRECYRMSEVVTRKGEWSARKV